MYPSAFILNLEANYLTGTIPGFFFDAVNSSMSIYLDVCAQTITVLLLTRSGSLSLLKVCVMALLKPMHVVKCAFSA